MEAAAVDLRWYTPCVLMYAQRGLNLLFPEDALKGAVKILYICTVHTVYTFVTFYSTVHISFRGHVYLFSYSLNYYCEPQGMTIGLCMK